MRPAAGAGGQRPDSVRGQLRHREPAGHDADVPRPVRRAAGEPGGRVPLPAARRAAGRRPGRRPRSRRGRAHPRRQQRGLLRARPAVPAHGRGAGRGPRPVLHRQPGLRPHHPRPPPGGRDLPPDRRRLPRPGPVPARFGHRLRRPHQRRAIRQRDHRQRGRQRRGRRQAHLHLRPRPDPVLLQRGAGAVQRRVVPAGRSGHVPLGAWRAAPAGAQAGGRGRRQGHRHRPARGRADAGRAARHGGRQPARLDRAAAGQPVHVPGADRGTAGAPPHRPAAVRGQRRQRCLAAARRPDPGRAAAGGTGGELQPGRRFQGHLGHVRRQPAARPARAARSRRSPPAPAAPRGLFRDRQSDPFEGQDQ